MPHTRITKRERQNLTRWVRNPIPPNPNPNPLYAPRSHSWKPNGSWVHLKREAENIQGCMRGCVVMIYARSTSICDVASSLSLQAVPHVRRDISLTAHLGILILFFSSRFDDLLFFTLILPRLLLPMNPFSARPPVRKSAKVDETIFLVSQPC